MSSRQLRALLANKPEKSFSRTKSGATQVDMSEERIKQLEAALEEVNQKTDEQSSELDTACERDNQYRQQIAKSVRSRTRASHTQ